MAVLDLPHPHGGAAPVAPQPPLHQLFEALAAAFAAEKAQNNTTMDSSMPQEAFQRLDSQVRALLAAYQGQEDFREYCRWHAQHYVRNLIASNDDLELMVCCWDKEQGSRIHSHNASHSWVAVLDGTIQERRYSVCGRLVGGEPAPAPELPGVLFAQAPCPQLAPAGTAILTAGDLLYINDRQGLHAMSCLPGANMGAVTLHIYAPPLRRVTLYEPERNRVVERKPGFYTVPGSCI